MSENELMNISKSLPSADSLDESQLNELKSRIFSLLARRARLYASGDTSVSRDDAKQLFESVCFILSEHVRLGGLSTAALLTGKAEDVFDMALASLKGEVSATQKLYNAVSLTAPRYMSTAYRDTVRCLKRYLDGYDMYYMAHLLPKDVDYQLCNPVDESHLGVRYVNSYLRNLYIENRFLRRFDAAKVEAVLRASYVDFRSIPLNLYEPVAVNSFGLVLLCKEPFSLNVGSEDSAAIEKLLLSSNDNYEALFSRTAERLCEQLSLTGAAEKEYVQKTVLMQIPRITAILGKESLSNIFLRIG